MSSKTVAIVQARTGSSRFPGKVLEYVGGKTLLEFQAERLKRSNRVSHIVIATTGSPKDDPIAALCKSAGLTCFRGSERDVLDRFYRCAKSCHADTIVRLTADCPVIDPAIIDDLVAAYFSEHADYAANTAPPPGTFPDGMDVEVFSMAALQAAWLEAEKVSDREHVTFFIWKQPNRFRLTRLDAPEDWSAFRFTVDYPEDLVRLRRLVDHFGGHVPGLPEIMKAIRTDPSLFPTSTHTFGEGWAPSLAADRAQFENSVRRAPPLPVATGELAWVRATALVPTGSQTFSKSPGQFVNGVAPKMLARGLGCRVWDADGNEFIDYTLGLGPAVLGHCHPEVAAAAASCASDIFVVPPLPHPMETALAERLRDLIPSAEMVKFGKNGSDVTSGAVRLARAVTGRDLIACCGYHGWQDWYIGTTSRRKGVPSDVQTLTKTFNYNDLDSLVSLFREYPGQIAGVILEPVTFEEPTSGFLQGLRDLCTKEGALLIFDEVITGFRLNMGGAQRHYGVTPDLSTFGKAIANGFPLSVLCGKAHYMRHFEDVFFSFTFGGELPSIAAAIATLDILERDNAVEVIANRGRLFRDTLKGFAKQLDLHYFDCIGLDFWPEYLFTSTEKWTPAQLLSLLQQEIVRRGILTRAAPFFSTAHSENDLRQTLQAYFEALLVVREAVNTGQVAAWLQGDAIQPVIRAEPKLPRVTAR